MHGVVEIAPAQPERPSPRHRVTVLSCDVCGTTQRSVRAVTRDELRQTVAPWIGKLCERCRERFAPRTTQT